MKTKTKPNHLSICPLCDETYDDRDPERVRVHQHPEPQSGPPRDAWIASRLPYKRWINETMEGREWNALNLGWKRHPSANGANWIAPDGTIHPSPITVSSRIKPNPIPKDAWDQIEDLFYSMTEKARARAFLKLEARFCRGCGCSQSPGERCQCQNDQ